MNEPTLIAYRGETGKGGSAFIRYTEENQPTSERPVLLYDDGSFRREVDGEIILSFGDAGSGIHNSGPMHRDDWYWNEAEQRLIEVATLSDQEYLAVSMSDAPRVTLHTEIDKEAIARIEAITQIVVKQARAMADERFESRGRRDVGDFSRFSGGSSRPFTEETFKQISAAIWTNGGSV